MRVRRYPNPCSALIAKLLNVIYMCQTREGNKDHRADGGVGLVGYAGIKGLSLMLRETDDEVTIERSLPAHGNNEAAYMRRPRPRPGFAWEGPDPGDWTGLGSVLTVTVRHVCMCGGRYGTIYSVWRKR